MNILMVNNRYYPALGGSETLIKSLSEVLVEKGHEVTVLATDLAYAHGDEKVSEKPSEKASAQSYQPPSEINGVKTVRVGAVRFGRDPFTFSTEMGGWMASHADEFDIIHTFTYGYHTSFGPVIAKGFGYFKKPIVFSPHYAPSQTVPSWASALFDMSLGELTVRAADHIVLLTGKYTDFFVKHGAKGEVISVIPPIVPPIPSVSNEEKMNVRKKFKIPEGKRIVLSLGRVVEYKGIQFLIEAVKQLKNQNDWKELNAHVVVSGDGEYRVELEKKAVTAGLKDDVTFTGMVSEREKEVLYRDAGVFSLLSYSGESFGIVLAEAMSCGTPLLGSDRGAVPYVLKDGRNGFIVDPFRTDEVAGALKKLLIPATARKFEMNNREDVKRYSKENVVSKMLAVYSSLSAS
jgi:glycosyltransferase involved in cell wall biosynthesis